VAAANALATYMTLGEFMELPEATVSKMSDALMAIVNDAAQPGRLRAAALATAGVRSGDPDIEREIERFSTSDDPELRLGAFQAMGRSGSRIWVSKLEDTAYNEDPEVRSQVANSLGAFEGEVVPTLSMLVREETDPAVRTEAITSLGRVGGKRALQALEALSGNVSADEATAVADAIEEAREWAELEDLEAAIDEDPDAFL